MLPGKKYGVQDYVAIVKRRWWLVPGPVVAAVFIALIVSSRVKDSYQSEMQIQIVPQQISDRIVGQSVASRTEDRMDSLEAMIKSRAQLEALITEFNLYPAERARMPMTDVVGIMRNAITVDLIRPYRGLPPDSFIVRFTYSDPDVAARLTSRLGSLFVDQNARERIGIADATNEFLQSRLEDAKNRLAAHERKMEEFRNRNAGRLPTQSDMNLQAIQSTQSQLQAQIESTARDRDRKLMLERLYNEAAAEPLPMPVAPPATDGTVAGSERMPLVQQVEVARATLSRLLVKLKPEHPDVRRAQRNLKELEDQLAAQPAAPAATAAAVVPGATPEGQARAERLRGWKAELESLDRQIRFKEQEQERLRGVLADYQRRLESTPGVESEWVALTRDYETLNNTYKTLLQKSEDSKMSGDAEKRRISEQFRVLDPAKVPVAPIGPVRLQINAIGFGVGLLIGLLLVAVVEFRDSTFRTEADVLDVLALPVLAIVPLVPDAAELGRKRTRRMMAVAVASFAVLSAGYVFWTLQLWKHIA
jgi:protein tyrosine kinase modulator